MVNRRFHWQRAMEGACAKFLRARFVGKLRSAEPLPTQPEIEIWSSETAVHNQKLDRAAFPCSSHTGREKFATGPPPPPPNFPHSPGAILCFPPKQFPVF